MPTSYAIEINDTFDAIKDAGAAVRIYRVGFADVPDDAKLPWEGSRTTPQYFDTYCLFTPLRGQAANLNRVGVQNVMIPAKGMTFELTERMQVQVNPDNDGPIYQISGLTKLAPDPEQVIFWKGQGELWR